MIKPITNKGYKLFHRGAIALAQVESNGMRIDEQYLNRSIKHTQEKISVLTAGMKEDPIYKLWRREYGSRTNINSREQLGKILFTVMDYDCPIRTKTGKAKVDETVLDTIDIPFVKNIIKLSKLKKAKTTYLEAILRESSNGFLHPFFNLHLTQTMRSSSDSINFQNIPIRDPKTAKLVRRAFISRNNFQIVEADFNGAEIACATCYHKDPKMITYISDETKDLHRDMAGQCYLLPKKEITKEIRYCGKNMFVFPEFYGDYYLHCAKNLWEAISQMKLHTKSGLYLKDYLKEKGIEQLGLCDPKMKPVAGTFEHHLKKVEDDFWGKRFKVYGQWKKDWFEAYLRKGYFDTLTGFRISGVYRRNEVINYPVQGSAFHWLLWSLIRIQNLLNKYKMKSLIVGQIHDSIVADVYKKELKEYLEIVQQVMTIDVKKHWKWINVPLSIEAEVSPVNGSWYEKEKVKI
jgi:DNA polymerase I-like protein with 3'-5' exonuclease and polymerase domains